MKSLRFVLIFIVLCVVLALPVQAADEFTEGYLTFTIVDGEAVLSGCNTAAEGVITIPSMVDKYAVTTIGGEAFANCTSVTQVIIPDIVSSIEGSAFTGCTGLQEIALPEGITSLRGSTFYNCSALSSVTLPSTLTKIEGSAFYNCTSLTEIYIPDSVTTIAGWAFCECKNLGTVHFPASLTKIEGYAFNNCNKLSDVIFGDSLTTIGSYAFIYCDSITSLELPASLKTLNPYAFYSCDNLGQIHVAADNPYYNSTDSGNAIYSENGKTIVWVTMATSGEFVIQEGVTDIGEGAFAQCTGLTGVVFPSSLLRIGKNAFNNTSLTGVVFPDGVYSISDLAFNNCGKMKSVVFPASVSSIGNNAFASCSSLTEITFHHASDVTTPSMIYTAFSTGSETATTIYVPDPENLNSKVSGYNWANANRTVTYVKIPSESFEITVSNGASAAGAVVTAPAGGWVEGTNTFTVSCDDACVVAVSYDGGATYTRLTATAAESGYSFTAENMTADTLIGISVLGDANGDGAVTSADVTRLRAAYAGKIVLEGLQNLAMDINGDGAVTSADVTRLRAAYAGKVTLTW